MFQRLSRAIDRRFPKFSAYRKRTIALIVCTFHLLGALTSIRAILDVRTAQGAVAWAISLNTFPYIAVPAYWIFGRSNFHGYVMLRRENAKELSAREHQLAQDIEALLPQPE